VPLIVVALGGHALLRRGEPADAAPQQANLAVAATAIAAVAREHDIVVTHGNGPQVGLLALQADTYRDVPAYPLDVLGAETEGIIGYLLERALRSELPGRPVATLLTQVLVELEDPAFGRPARPIGPVYRAGHAQRLAAERGWSMVRDGEGYRRVVPSPEPRQVLELSTIRLLVDAGVVVTCAGGGGIPVIVRPDGQVRGVEAVIDKDLAAALLAVELDADLLVMLTDVDGVYAGWGTAHERRLTRLDVSDARALSLAKGSMGPKVEAACRFAEQTAGRAAIGRLDDAAEIVAGRAGTQVVASAVAHAA
jgi:carbamate kinase